MDTHVALVGLSGTGKSTVAPELAQRWSIPSADLDRLVEAEVGTTVAELFAADGEPAFRSVESRVLAGVLDGPPTVVATGGGIVVSAPNRVLLRERAVVVWLRADLDVLVTRLSATSEERPLLGEDAANALRHLDAEREPLYREVADVVVDTTAIGPEELVDGVAEAVEDHVRMLRRTGR